MRLTGLEVAISPPSQPSPIKGEGVLAPTLTLSLRGRGLYLTLSALRGNGILASIAVKIETAAARASHHVDAESGAILAPIQPSTTFERAEDGEFPSGYIYSRLGNPNRRQLEDILTTLEGGAACAAFSSGSAASAAVFQALGSGDHVVAPNDCYHGTRAILRDVFGRWGLEVTFTDVTDPEQVEQAMRPNTRLVWVETPSNPMLKVTDIRRTVEIAHEAGALCVCDNTWATPMLQRPIGARRGCGGAFDDEVHFGA